MQGKLDALGHEGGKATRFVLIEVQVPGNALLASDADGEPAGAGGEHGLAAIASSLLNSAGEGPTAFPRELRARSTIKPIDLAPDVAQAAIRGAQGHPRCLSRGSRWVNRLTILTFRLVVRRP